LLVIASPFVSRIELKSSDTRLRIRPQPCSARPLPTTCTAAPCADSATASRFGIPLRAIFASTKRRGSRPARHPPAAILNGPSLKSLVSPATTSIV
jgi:hypothetical protein